MSVSVTVTGHRSVDRALARLTGPEQRKYIRQGATAAGREMIRLTKPRIPDRRRRDDKKKLIKGLKKSITQIPSSKWKNRSELRRQDIIGTRVGFKRGGAHAHLVEKGHEIVTRGGKTHEKKVPPYPFMRPAMDAGKAGFRLAFQRKIMQGIRRNTRRA